MNDKELLQGYNESVEGKKTNKLAMILITCFCGIITLTTLVFHFISDAEMVDKVKVVNVYNGDVLDSNLKRRADLINSGCESTVNRAVYYSNSFDRVTINSNKARALFLMDNNSAYPIFEKYKKDRSYEDAIQRGHIYEIVETELTSLQTDKGEPYTFTQKSILRVKDGHRTENFIVRGEGKITYRKPIYPENEHGFWISDYSQTLQKIEK